MPLSTRMAERYHLHLLHLRTLAHHHLEGAERAEMNEAIEDLADTLMAGGPTVVQVEIEVPPAVQVAEGIEAARAELGISTFLDDTAPITSHDRDNRRSA